MNSLAGFLAAKASLGCRTLAYCCAALIASFAIPSVNAQGTAFDYQGRLIDNGTPSNGRYTMRFSLFDGETSGSQVGNTFINDNVIVTNGLFSTALDFGAVFDGTTYFLEINVQPRVTGALAITLNPRQRLRPTPYALYSAKAGTVTNGAIANPQLALGAQREAHGAAHDSRWPGARAGLADEMRC